MDISIVITCYNYGSFLERAIRSSLNQTIAKENYEIIVVNDGSTDGTSEVLKVYKNDIRIINFINNQGLSSARNEGIKQSKGRFIINLDADDHLICTNIEYVLIEDENSNVIYKDEEFKN